MVRVSASVVVLLGLVALGTSCAKDPEVAKREYVRSGDEFVAQKKYREAIIEYRNAVAADARFGEARLKLGEAYLQVGEMQNAAGQYIRAADLMPDNLEAQLKAAHLLL